MFVAKVYMFCLFSGALQPHSPFYIMDFSASPVIVRPFSEPYSKMYLPGIYMPGLLYDAKTMRPCSFAIGAKNPCNN